MYTARNNGWVALVAACHWYVGCQIEDTVIWKQREFAGLGAGQQRGMEQW